MEKVRVEKTIWETGAKIASFVLTGFVLPLLALAAKSLYRNWALKGLETPEIDLITLTHGRGVSKIIQMDINVKKGLIEDSKEIAEDVNESLSSDIQSNDIIDKKDLIEIANIAAAQGLRGVLEHIAKFGIKDKKALIEIAKIVAAQDGWGVSVYIKNYDIKDKDALIEIAKIAAAQDGWGVSKYIENYEIEDEKALIEIAKIAAAQDGGGVSEYIEEYDIKDKKALIEIAKIAAAQSGGGVSAYMENYDIKDKDALIEIAKIAAAQGGVSEHIKNYEIEDEKALIEIAKIAAAQSGGGVSAHIRRYGIKDEDDLFEIAKIEAAWGGDGVLVLMYIRNYDIKGQHFTEFRELIKNPVERYVIIKSSVSDIPLEWFDKVFESSKIQSKLIPWIIPLIEDVRAGSSILEEKNQTFLKEIALLRNDEIRDKITAVLQTLYKNDQAVLDTVQQINDKPPHTYLPRIALSFFAKEDPSFYEEVLTLFTGNKNRTWFRDAEKMNNFLDFVFMLKDNAKLTFEEKKDLVMKTMNANDKDRIKIISLFKVFLNGNHREKLKNLPKEKLLGFLGIQMQNLFVELFRLEESNDFTDKYVKTFGAFRKNYALFSYQSSLMNSPEEKITLPILSSYVKSVLDGTFKETRYDIKDNMHLKKIFEGSPGIEKGWKLGYKISADELLSTIVEATERTGEKAIEDDYFKTFFKRKLETDQHLKNWNSYSELIGVLNGSKPLNEALLKLNEELKDLEGKDQSDQVNQKIKKIKIELACLNILKISVKEKQKIIEELQKLKVLVAEEELANDLSLPIDLFSETKLKKRNLSVVDTDDPCDLLLIGTEVQGSCQRVDGDGYLNKGLLAYLMDGKHRAVVVKDETGCIVARSIIRLLYDEVENKAVLFQERLYTAYNDPQLDVLVRAMCKKRAADLKLPLLNLSDEGGLKPYPNTISCTMSMPFEYVDAAGGIQTMGYSLRETYEVPGD